MREPRNALITGSTSGIGLGIATAFAAEGMNVVLNGFGAPQEIEKLRAGLAVKHGVQVRYAPADVSKPDEIREMIAYAKAELGQIDVLVNNAGIQHVSPVEEFPDELWESIIRVDLISCFYTIKGVLKDMKEASWGRVINIVSAHGLVASRDKSAYVAAKHGLLGLGKTIALEAAQYRVTVNSICPGYVKTPLLEKQIPDTARARNMTEEQVIRDVILAVQPTREFVTVEQIAALAVFLCTDAAASINGAALSMDGGWTAQ